MALENVKLDMRTRLIPIIGCPMDHSSASYVYNYLFGRYGMNAIMWPLEIEKGRLGEFMAARSVMNIDLFTLTMPHKADIIPLLDEVDECSRLFNSVNIVKNIAGRSFGTSCDGKGCAGALTDAGVSLKDKRVLILGAGSISGILGYEFTKLGAGGIVLVNRTLENARRVAKILNDNTDTPAEAYENTADALAREARKADVVIQCSALGMHGFGADYDDLSFLGELRDGVPVMEAIVNPPETRFLAEAKRLGHPVVHGMDMLVSQMREIFDCWFGIRITDGELAESKRILMRHFGVEES